jgi:hypothetical protein
MSGRLAAGALIALVGGFGAAAVMFVHPALDWPTEPSAPLDGRAVVELDGRVTRVDAGAGALWVAPTVLGLNARRLGVDGQTRIFVGAKEGGLGDVPVGARVVVICDPGGEPIARWVGVNMEHDTLRAAASRAAAGDGATDKRIVPPPPSSPAASPAANVTPALPVSGASAEPAHPVAATRRSPAPSPSAAVRAPAPRPSAVAPPPRPVERSPAMPARDADDPGAVIDWLLRGAGRN